MTIKAIDKLADLINQQRDAILARWRKQVRELPSARHLDVPSLNDHMPVLLGELAVALHAKSEQTIPEVLSDGSAPAHGLQRAHEDFDIQEVVAEYNILRGCIHDLADDNGLILQGEPFHILNGVFDQAIGLALQTYATAKAIEVQHLEKLVAKVLDENTHLQTEIGIKLERRSIDLWPLVEALIHDLHPVAGTSSTKLINHVPDDMVVYADASLLSWKRYSTREKPIRTARGERASVSPL